MHTETLEGNSEAHNHGCQEIDDNRNWAAQLHGREGDFSLNNFFIGLVFTLFKYAVVFFQQKNE